jgi:lysyl-tRNA synthetase, class II
MTKKTVSERSDRLQKLESIESKGIKAYPAKTKKTHNIKEVLADFVAFEKNKNTIILAGRIRSKRSHGNLIFINLQDGQGKMQIAISKKDVGVEAFKDLDKLVDVGDFIEVTGACFITHKGENSILTSEWRLLTKAIRPLPEKWHGLKDDEDRYRKRYLDLLMNDELRDIFVKKSKFWDVTRSFMKDHGFFEVETPTLETTTGGAEAAPFKTFHNDFDLPVYLRISVGELWQKRLMAAGFEKTFEIGRVYRNEGSSPNHLQEFTNMEFYWAYANYEDGMNLTRELYITLAKEVFGTTKFKTRGYEYDLACEWKKIDYREEILSQTGVDVLETSEKEIKKKLEELKVKYEGDNRERLTDTLWKYCRNNITGPAFLINHPKLISPLAKAMDDNPLLTERFQILIAGAEIGNGYSELNDPIEQRKRFEEQQELLDAGDDEAMMPDWEFVEMLEHGMPPTCGFGFGERLFSFFVNSTVRETSLFPLMKPTESHLAVKKEGEKHLSVKKITKGDLGLDYDAAKKLFDEFVKDDIVRMHMIETEAIMRALAVQFGEDADTWGIIGLLHDIDWDITKDDVQNHCVKAIEILKEAGASELLVNTIISHAYGNVSIPAYIDRTREGRVEHCLVSAETITGLIVASALMQPDKKLASVKLKSIKKKYKVKSFAKNCNRELITEIEKTGLSLDEFFEISLKALQGISDRLSL